MKTSLKIAAAALAIILISLVGFIADAQLRIAGEETIPADEGAPGRFITVDGNKLLVATIGDLAADGPVPILLLHGGSVQGHTAWLPWASKLAAGHALILPDLPGFGHSARVTTPGPVYTLKGQAAAVAAILDAMGVPQVDIIGNGLGGGVAAQFAIDYPARVRRIVFMDAAIYTFPRMTQTGLGVMDRALAWHYRGGGPRGKVARSCGPQAACRALRLARVQGTTDALCAMASTSDEGRLTLAQNISAIKAPALVIWGGNDTQTPVADGDRLARELNASFSVIADAENMPYLSQPDRLAQRILGFLKSAQ